MNRATRLRMVIVGLGLALAGTALAEVPNAGASPSKDAKGAPHASKDAKDKEHAAAKHKPDAQASKHAAKKGAEPKGMAGKSSDSKAPAGALMTRLASGVEVMIEVEDEDDD